jgi:hypothetical protein
MSDQTDLPANLRKSANRRSIPRRPPRDGTQLTDAAQLGILTKANTKSGTRGRQAVDRVTYHRRTSRRVGLTARQAVGHPKALDRPPVISIFVADPPRQVVIEGLSRADLSRAAKYDNAVSELARGRVAPASFERRFSAWRPIAGYRLLADPDAVLALLDRLRAEDREPFILDSGRT